jgi:peptidoglycan/xylan/chitin deacetylase (PgdA/CDA1 family)
MSVWPDGYQSAAAITVNFDGESFEQPLLPGEPLWGRYAYGRYGAQVGVYRLLDVFRRYEIRATFFVPGWDSARYPEVMEAIASAGHELAGRGYANENFSALPADEQRVVLEKSEAAFERAFGYKPAGWRGPSAMPGVNDPGQRLAIPGSLLSNETRSILVERGYRYDSSFCDDDIPYVVENNHGQRLVELPHFATASDRPYYEQHRMPAVVSAAWREELSAVHKAGGLFTLTISPRGDWGSGRGVRIHPVEDLLQSLRETSGVWLATCGEIAEWALESNRAGVVYPA